MHDKTFNNGKCQRCAVHTVKVDAIILDTHIKAKGTL